MTSAVGSGEGVPEKQTKQQRLHELESDRKGFFWPCGRYRNIADPVTALWP